MLGWVKRFVASCFGSRRTEMHIPQLLHDMGNTFLGEGIYVRTEGGKLILTHWDGAHVSDTITISTDVRVKLAMFIDDAVRGTRRIVI